jgi:hypothetical protein
LRNNTLTKDEWLGCTRPAPMLKYLRGKASARKLRLFAVACCRRIWNLLPDDASRHAVVLAEGFADGQVSSEDLLASRMAVERRRPALVNSPVSDVAPAACQVVRAATARAVDRAVSGASFHTWYAVERGFGLYPGWTSIREQEERAQCHYLRDLFGNPFCLAALDPGWRSPTAVAIADGMYGARDFTAMPLLADALQDAGCENADILGHCRGDGPHARGCWVVDLVLGRA